MQVDFAVYEKWSWANMKDSEVFYTVYKLSIYYQK